MFAGKGKLVTSLKLWWNPPPVAHDQGIPPHPDCYHLRRVLLWAPRMMWKVNFSCSHCGQQLRSKGLYNHVRLVMDTKDYYYVAAEYMDCRACSGTFISWDQRILCQLTSPVLSHGKMVPRCLRSRRLEPYGRTPCSCYLHTWFSLEN